MVFRVKNINIWILILDFVDLRFIQEFFIMNRIWLLIFEWIHINLTLNRSMSSSSITQSFLAIWIISCDYHRLETCHFAEWRVQKKIFSFFFLILFEGYQRVSLIRKSFYSSKKFILFSRVLRYVLNFLI